MVTGQIRSLTLLLALLTVGLLGAQSAGAAYLGETRDPAGDSTSSHPGHDIIAVGIGFDRKTGQMAGAVALRGSPELGEGAFLTLYAGMRTADGCDGHPVGGFGSLTDGSEASWVREDRPGSMMHGEASKSGYLSSVQTFEVTIRRLAGKRWNCLGANLSDPDDPSTVFDRIEPVPLRGLPAMAVRIQKLQKVIPVNRARKIRMVISNPGDGPMRNVRLRFSGDRGLNMRPRQAAIRVIRPGGRRVVPVRVVPRRAAGTSPDLKVTARSGALVVRESLELKVRQPRRKPPPADGGGGGGGTCVQYFPDLSGETGGSLGLVPC